MAKSEDGPLPQQSESQRIGHLAGKCFAANAPNAWLAKPTEGTDDFGYDYQIQTVKDGSVRDIFRAQLKGSLDAELSADGTYYSVQLKASTVRFFSRATEPILLVLADLKLDPDRPANCPLFHAWVHDELRRLNDVGIPDEQKYVTFRIPAANKLTGATDLSEDLSRFRRLAQVGDALDLVAEQKQPGMPPSARADLIGKIPGTFARSSSALLDAMSRDTPGPWPEAPAGSFPWYLHEATQWLRSGAATEVEARLRQAEALIGAASDPELAEYWFIKGRLMTLNLEPAQARDAFEKAMRLSANTPKYVTAWAESELRVRHKDDKTVDLSDVIARVTCSDPECVGIRARLWAAMGKFEKAIEVAQQAGGLEASMALAIIYTMQGEPKLVLRECETGLSNPSVRVSTRHVFLVLRARAEFNLALGIDPRASPEAEIPLSGPVGTNVGHLKKAWPSITQAVESLRLSGWAPNIEFLADVWSSTASILGKQQEVLPLISQAAETRPNIQSLQAALENIAVQCGDADVALIANGRQPRTDTGTLRRIVELHMARRHGECVRHFDEHGIKVSPAHPQFGFALSAATLSANRILRPDLVERWRQLSSSIPELATHHALLNYLLATSRDVLSKEPALTQLEERYEALGKPFEIAIHIFHELDASDKAQALKCVQLARRLEEARMLHAEAVLHQAQALATLERWEELLELGKSARVRFEGNGRFVAVEALALDRLGKSAEAMSSLKLLIAEGKVDAFALNTYINIVVRCGFTEEAIDSVEKVLSTETQQNKQVETLRLLFSLVHLAEPFSGRGVDIAWRLGQIVDREDEAQEGLFLILMLTATLHAPVSAGDPRIPEFQQRLEDFTKKHPTSKILRSAHLPQDAGSEQILRMLREIAGLDEERLRWREKVVRQLQRGEIAIPYAWRPRQILMNVPDLPTLWEITKNSKPTDAQYHLLMVTSDWKPVPRPSLDGPPPLLDLVSLLVVSDLKIFDYLFEIFRQIAIGQGTLLALMQLTAPMSGSPLRKRCIELQNELKAKFTRILQPSVAIPPGAKEMPRWDTEEVRTLVRGGRYRLYSDDAIFRAYCELPELAPTPICSLDVLDDLDHQSVLTVKEVAEKYSILCRWHVGLQISLRYQVAALPDALGAAKSVGQGIDILRATPSCAAIFDEIWDPRKPLNQFVGHGAAILRALAGDSSNRIDSVASLLGLWWGKARLRKDTSPQPGAIAAQLVMSVVGSDPPPSAEIMYKLWSVYRALIALEHGDRMDEEKERQAIVRAGQFAANVDHKTPRQGNASLYSRAAIGLTAGTSDADAFQKGYQQTLAELVRKGPSPRA